ncbi:MAG TPA: ABC transporter permease [Candidatus Sulfotelmatobacter sp.]|jgi:ABC-2 type transport system permease protein|nr:ABC transporter permease [Candidatus Sulfotelmatobacter sp.]
MKKQYRKLHQIRAFFVMMKYFFLAQTRNPATFAFGFLFPVVFISIFGLIGNSQPSLTIGLPSNSDLTNPIIKILEQQKFVKTQIAPESQLETSIKQGKLSGIVSVTFVSNNPPKYQANVITSLANPQEASGIMALVNAIVDRANLSAAGVTNPPITVVKKELAGRQTRYIDFALPGQIGFALLSTAIFGTVFGLIYLKKALVLKRMFATPTRAITILLAQGGSRLIMAVLQTLLILILGIVVFKFYLPHGFITFIELLFLSIIALIAFLGFGYFMAGLANDENSAGPLVNLVTLPQFLLSGTFFPIDNLPTWLQPLANILPLSFFNAAVRKITTEGGDFSQTIPFMLGLILWGAVMYLLAAKTFRWE